MSIWDRLFNEKIREKIKLQHMMDVKEFESALMNLRIDKQEAKLLTRHMVKKGMFAMDRKKNGTFLKVR